MSDRKKLLDLLKSDPFGLLKGQQSRRPQSPQETLLVTAFEEIQTFVEENNREPAADIESINEFRLYSRLKAIRSDPSKVRALKKYDFSGLLTGKEVKEIGVEDIISNDPLGLLGGDAEPEIHSLKNVKPVERIRPEFLARRKSCKDFAQYRDMFDVLQNELESKRRRLIKFKTSDLQPGGFYVLRGVLFHLKSIDGKLGRIEFESGDRHRFDGRTLCIFDNGTQSDLLFRSLDKAMQHDGYSIGPPLPPNAAPSVDSSDVTCGYIYVLKSRNARVREIPDLHKIGHTTGAVTQRIKNAKQEATYLFAEVDVVSVFRCLNVQSLDLERAIHDFFENVKLDVELIDGSGNTYKPREWFRVSLEVIEDAISLIIEGRLHEFTYDDKVHRIVKR